MVNPIAGMWRWFKAIRRQLKSERLENREFQSQIDIARIYTLFARRQSLLNSQFAGVLPTENQNSATLRALSVLAPSFAARFSLVPLSVALTPSKPEDLDTYERHKHSAMELELWTKRLPAPGHLREYIDEIALRQVLGLFRVIGAASQQYPQISIPLFAPILASRLFSTAPLSGLSRKTRLADKFASPRKVYHVESIDSSKNSDHLSESDKRKLRKTITRRDTDITAPPISDLEELCHRIKDRIGFVVQREDSEVHGKGVFLRGSAIAGTIVALIPGIGYRPTQRSRVPGYPAYTENNDKIFSRIDDIIVDAKPQHACQLFFGADLEPKGSEEEIQTFWDNMWQMINPFAVGHHVNHPPKGVQPNVYTAPFEFDLSQIPSLSVDYVPNRSCMGSDWGRGIFTRVLLNKKQQLSSKIIPAMVIVAARDLCDEELFLNYRFNPHSKLIPKWYNDPDPEESKRRWGRNMQ